jgi:membrane dipeptidase
VVTTTAERLHREAFVIDATCPLLTGEYVDWWIEGGVTAAAPTVGGFLPSGPTMTNLAGWLRLIRENPKLRLVRSARDVEEAKESGQFGIIFHFQGTDAFDNDLNLVEAYKALGVGMVQLTYNVKNRVGDGCDERTDCGLSNFGVELVKRLNQARIIVDGSHTGYTTTMEAIELSTAPFVFSHANAKAVYPSARNLTDDQIKAVAATGGLVGAVGFPPIVSDSPRPTLGEFLDHIDYIVNLVGIDHVGLGIDYYQGQAGVVDLAGAQKLYRAAIESGRWRAGTYPPPPYNYPEGIETPRTFHNITKGLLERGYDEASVEQILGGNWLRVFRAVWGE